MRRGGLVAVSVFLAATGCRRPAPPPPAPPATQTVVVQPATQPTALPPSVFNIAGQPFNFPPCKVVTRQTDSGLRVTLYSDDPPDALRDGYLGNSFYFRFVLEDATELVGQQYEIRRSADDTEETSNGLFIAGGRQTLRPRNVRIAFDRVDDQTVVTVGGQFALHEEQGGDVPTQVVQAQAELEAAVSEAKK